MSSPPAVVARPFLPAKDLKVSTRFYETLGFQKLLEGDVSIFSCKGAGGFILTSYYVEEWAQHVMMQLMVEDLDAWWAHIESLDLTGAFAVLAPKAPEVQPWGLRVAYVVDPAGVLWHVAQRREGVIQDGA